MKAPGNEIGNVEKATENYTSRLTDFWSLPKAALRLNTYNKNNKFFTPSVSETLF
jgi:hypothetical protein